MIMKCYINTTNALWVNYKHVVSNEIIMNKSLENDL